uniref:Reverse transcriptase domain-containing protein n=1 Tax=Strongyloides papillosus TaxID=174720 RepID=A0A0N5B3W2_STREA
MEWIKAVYERRCNLTDEDTRGRAFGIFKKGNIDDPKNYRFINVTNSHYKIFMKYLNSVIVDQIEHRIPKEQIANKKGRSCLDGIIINRLIQKKTVHGQQIAQTWLDMQKAYDSLDHKKLLIVLENLGIHRDFIEIIKKAMRCWKFTVINGKETYMNNEKKKKKPTVIHVNRGIYQGDSLSPTLFVCSLIPLSWMLNQQPRINLEDPNTEANVVTTMNDDEVEDEGLYNHLLFMDDIKLFSINAKCLNEMTKICEKYGLEIGLKINPLKSSYSINQGEQAEEPLINFEELSTVYKYLGIYENHKTADEKANLQELYKVVDEKLKLILESPITVGNMIDAINTCLMPKILYVFSHERSELIKRKIYLDMDLRIRKALNTYGVKFQNLSNARIYLPRSRFGLGLKSTETEIDKIQLKNFIHIKYSEVFRKMNETFKMMENDIIIIASKYNINMSFEEGLPCINGTIGSEKEAKKKISELVDNFAYKRWAEHYTRKKEFPKFVINNKLICPWLRTLNIEPRKFKTITMTQDDMHPMLNPIFDKESKCVLETNSVKCNHYDNIRHVGSYCEHSVSWRRRRHDNVLHTITNVLLRKLKQKMVDLNNYKKCYKIDDNTELRIDQLNYTSESLVHNKPDIIYETKDKIIIGEIIHVNRGIYQGDSLSPTLFVCSLIPLSWMLNQQPRINLEDPNTEANVVTTMNDDEVEDEGLYNHLLFMDDIKLFSINAKCLNEMTKICEKYGLEIGLKINPLKSSYSINQGEQAEEPLINFEELSTVYKYLGIYENHKTADEKANLQELYKVVDEKLKLILESPITVGNMIDAINTCLMPKILYVFSHERSELIKRKIYLDMDLRIRKALNTYGVKFQNLSNARIYLPRSRFGLGLKST